MRNRVFPAFAALMIFLPGSVAAEPGLANEIYGPRITMGETEVELRTGFLIGGSGDGTWQMRSEVSHGMTDWWRPALVAEWEREAGSSNFSAWSIENLFDFAFSRAWPVHFGGYVEYEFKQEGADEIELKLLSQRINGPWDLRLNLVGERHIGSGVSDAWEFGYAAQADYAIRHEFRIGLQAFGDAGTDIDFGNLGSQAHYVGPFAIVEVANFSGREIYTEFGYLFGIGAAESDGQIRFKIEYEF